MHCLNLKIKSHENISAFERKFGFSLIGAFCRRGLSRKSCQGPAEIQAVNFKVRILKNAYLCIANQGYGQNTHHQTIYF
jgi:hypothetical protein